ncbi:winged helix-turn-helix domain-containing protein [Shewanella mangrovi]|uniref:winged helix-turn-helix domain-containing protein n=1 Tax=Shewanella mangrovi TaxID=1515746 RepID=UPI00068B05F5|nr:winged helix-turn-helix domain-containing protein [Shewanella mangrovi]
MNFLVVTDDEQWQLALVSWIATKEQTTSHNFALHSLNDPQLPPQLSPDVVVVLSRRFTKPSEHQQLAVFEKLPFIYSSPASIDADIAPVLNEYTAKPFISYSQRKGQVCIGKRLVLLTDTELKIFRFLHQQEGNAVSKQEMQQQVLQRDYGQFDRNLDMHIANIRKKLQQAGIARNMILTVRGRGYSFNQELLARCQAESA